MILVIVEMIDRYTVGWMYQSMRGTPSDARRTMMEPPMPTIATRRAANAAHGSLAKAPGCHALFIVSDFRVGSSWLICYDCDDML
jgi:hypothetical protein